MKQRPFWASSMSNRPDELLENFLVPRLKAEHICSCIPTGGTLAHESYSSNSLIWVISPDQSSKQATVLLRSAHHSFTAPAWNLNLTQIENCTFFIKILMSYISTILFLNFSDNHFECKKTQGVVCQNK